MTIKTFFILTAALLVNFNVFAGRLATDDESHISDSRIQHLNYTFPPTGESIPYALFVPSTYNEVDEAPLIISLHGLGRSYDCLMGYHGFLEEAEAHGYIVVTPLGYIRRGRYGSRPTEDPIDAQYSEQDVMEVITLVTNEYNIDQNRVYLWGHSMGGAGTYHIAAKNPEMFAAIGVAAPAPQRNHDIEETLDRIKHIPTLVLQGDEDSLVTLTRTWVKKMQDIGMPHLYVEIPGGDHSLVISQDTTNMKKFIDFFNIVRKKY